MAKVLIVDDSKISRKMLRNIIEKHGDEVIGEAENGKIAISKAIQLQPDIITLDITMPVMDGLEALKEIKKNDNNVKIIMITAAGQREKMIQAIKSGAAEFLTKPFDEQEVINILNVLNKS